MKILAKIIQEVYMRWLLFTVIVAAWKLQPYGVDSVFILALLVLILGSEFLLSYKSLIPETLSFYYLGAVLRDFFGLVGLAAIPMLGTPPMVSMAVYNGLLLGCVLCVLRMVLLIKQIRQDRRSY